MIGLLATTGIVIPNVVGLYAFFYGASIPVSIIMDSSPVFIIAIAVLVRERITFWRTVGVVIGFLGCALVLNGKITNFQLTRNISANLIALVVSISWAVYTVIAKQLVRERGALAVASLTMIVGSAPIILFAVIFGEIPNSPSLSMFLYLAYLAIFPTAIGFVLWYKALETLDAGRLGALLYLVTSHTAIMRRSLLNEVLNTEVFRKNNMNRILKSVKKEKREHIKKLIESSYFDFVS